MNLTIPRGRVLDIDVECLPGHWIGGDYVSKIITAIGWKWINSRRPVTALTHYQMESEDLAVRLAELIAEADLVVGHYIRGFDLPLLNGNLLRAGAPPMGSVLTEDTKGDLMVTHGRSLSQKNLAAQIGVHKPKIDVTLYEWECFNTRRPGFEGKGIKRVEGDVLQNIEMRAELHRRGWLGPPKIWDGSSKKGAYHP